MWSLCHPEDLAIPSISSGWLMADALCHPTDIAGVGISSGWVTANALCHPDDILFHLMLSGWLNWGWYLIRMSYVNVMMSSRWQSLPFLNHPDERANFDFPQHGVAPKRFHITPLNRDTSWYFTSPTKPYVCGHINATRRRTPPNVIDYGLHSTKRFVSHLVSAFPV